MKKSFSIYSIIWAICLAVFNVITFVTPNKIGEVSKFGGAFWVGYIFITVAFIGQLACAFAAFRAKNLNKLFYNVSLISISYGGLVAMLIAGGIFMAIPELPEWIGIIVCVIILAFNAIAVIKATAAAGIVGGIDGKIKTQTFFIKSLTVDAQELMTSTRSEELRLEAKKVYEAIRYSDPMSNEELTRLDSQIESGFTAFSDAVKAEDVELTKQIANELIETVEKRNGRCKLLK